MKFNSRGFLVLNILILLNASFGLNSQVRVDAYSEDNYPTKNIVQSQERPEDKSQSTTMDYLPFGLNNENKIFGIPARTQVTYSSRYLRLQKQITQLTNQQIATNPQAKTINQGDVKLLTVPYFNQCAEKNNASLIPKSSTSNPSEICKNMCSGATMVMLAGYFDRLAYDKSNPYSLKKYMYSDSGQGISDSCGANQGGAFGMIARETDSLTQGQTACNTGSQGGMRKYAASRGLYTKDLGLDLNSIKDSIDRGHPVILSTPAHIFVFKDPFL